MKKTTKKKPCASCTTIFKYRSERSRYCNVCLAIHKKLYMRRYFAKVKAEEANKKHEAKSPANPPAPPIKDTSSDFIDKLIPKSKTVEIPSDEITKRISDVVQAEMNRIFNQYQLKGNN